MKKPQSFTVPLEKLTHHYSIVFDGGAEAIGELIQGEGTLMPGIVGFVDFFSERHKFTGPEKGHTRIVALVMSRAFREVYGEISSPSVDDLLEADSHVRPFYEYLFKEDEQGMQAAYKVFKDNHLETELLRFIELTLITANVTFHIVGDPVQHETHIAACLWVVAEVLMLMNWGEASTD